MGSAKNSENYMPVKNTSYTVIIYIQALEFLLVIIVSVFDTLDNNLGNKN